MTLRDYTALVKRTKRGKNANRAPVGRVFAGEIGKNLDPLHVEGWGDLGRVLTMPDFITKPDKEQIKAGLPGGLLINLPKDEIRDMSFAFDMYQIQTLQMGTANTAQINVNTVTGASTTISSATKSSGTLASASNFAVGDTVLVDIRHATYGGFKELTVITKINGTAVEFEPLSFAPANSSTFKKVAGKQTGTNKTDTGIYIPRPIVQEFPRVQLLVVFDVSSNNSLVVLHIPEFEIYEGYLPNFAGDTLAKVGFTGNPIIQDPKSFTMLDGTTQSLPFYDDYYIIPYESANS